MAACGSRKEKRNAFSKVKEKKKGCNATCEVLCYRRTGASSEAGS
jgi:hypothetical protein